MNDYFYLDANNQQQGPVSPDRFAALGVTAETLVWCNGMKDWAPAGSVAELAQLFHPSAEASSASPQQPVAPPPYNTGGSTYGTGAGNSYGTQYQNGTQQYQSGTQQYQNAAGAWNCAPPKPDNYLVWAILTTVCCCMPFGIVSIVYASKVDSLYIAQQYVAAQQAADNAKKWAIISAISVVIWPMLFIMVTCSSLALP